MTFRRSMEPRTVSRIYKFCPEDRYFENQPKKSPNRVAIPREEFDMRTLRRIGVCMLWVFAATALTVIPRPLLAVDIDPKKTEPVAVVNGQPITKSAFDRELTWFKERLERQGRPVSPPNLPMVSKMVLENLIANELLWQESDKLKIVADDAAVDEQLGNMKKGYPDEKAFYDALGKYGLSGEDVRGFVRRSLSIKALVDREIVSKIKVSQEDARAFYDENPQLFQKPEMVKASHILVKVAPDADEKAKQTATEKIKTVQKKAVDGGDFAELAKTHSEGPSGPGGGDLGFFSREQMVKPFSDAAFSLKPGEISDVVETRFGYHVIRASERKGAESITFEDSQEKIIEKLRREKVREKTSEYVASLRSGAEIKTDFGS